MRGERSRQHARSTTSQPITSHEQCAPPPNPPANSRCRQTVGSVQFGWRTPQWRPSTTCEWQCSARMLPCQRAALASLTKTTQLASPSAALLPCSLTLFHLSVGSKPTPLQRPPMPHPHPPPPPPTHSEHAATHAVIAPSATTLPTSVRVGSSSTSSPLNRSWCVWSWNNCGGVFVLFL